MSPLQKDHQYHQLLINRFSPHLGAFLINNTQGRWAVIVTEEARHIITVDILPASRQIICLLNNKHNNKQMKTLVCKDLGVADCEFVAKAETAEGAIKLMSDHGTVTHKDIVDKMSDTMTPDEMSAMMLKNVKDEA